jgi:hypothetical protein
MPRRVLSLSNWGLVFAGLVLAFLAWQDRVGDGERESIRADQRITRAKVDENSRRIDLSTATAHGARRDHARILAELKAIREHIGAPAPDPDEAR